MNNFIAASIIAADFFSLENEYKKLNQTDIKWVHFDIMDGHFVPNITIGSCDLDAILKKTNIPIDIHFMVDNPDYIVPLFIKNYSNKKISNVSVHVESCQNIKKLSNIVRKNKISFGLAINPNTSINKIINNLKYIDLALVMTVKPGFAGQKIIQKCINKVKKLRNYFDKNNISIPIQVDGGIKLENISLLSDAGANIYVSGTGIFNTNNYIKTVNKMKKIVE